MAHFFNLLLLAVFFGGWWWGGFYAATAALMFAAALQVLTLKIVKKSVPKITLLAFALIVVFGGLTLFLRDEFFLKIKTTVLYYFFALALLAADFGFKKNLARLLLGTYFEASAALWRRTSLAMAGFCLFLGTANLIVTRYYSQETWVWAKTVAYPAVSLLFFVALVFYLHNRAALKNRDPDS